MNKGTFLVELREHLSILEDQEQNDVLEEYAQHIDMKMKEGFSEEEAVQDFGTIEELAAEILEAYHVKPEFLTKRPVLRLPKIQSGNLEKEKSFLKASGKWLKSKWGILCHGAGNVCRWLKERCYAFFRWMMKPIRVRKKRDLDAADASGLWEESDRTDGESLGERKGTIEMKEKRDSLIQKAGRGIVVLWKWLIGICTGCLRIFWNLGWLMFSLFCAFFAVILLMGVGTLIVLLFQGYPLMGIFLIILGGMLCFASLSYGAFRLIRRNGRIRERCRE